MQDEIEREEIGKKIQELEAIEKETMRIKRGNKDNFTNQQFNSTKSKNNNITRSISIDKQIKSSNQLGN